MGFSGVNSSIYFGADQVHATIMFGNCVRYSGIAVYLEWDFLVIIHSVEECQKDNLKYAFFLIACQISAVSKLMIIFSLYLLLCTIVSFTSVVK